jgi:hypothetical protein
LLRTPHSLRIRSNTSWGRGDTDGIRAAYGVYLLREHQVWAPRGDSAGCDGLAYPPAGPKAFSEFADALVRSDRIAGMLDGGV